MVGQSLRSLPVRLLFLALALAGPFALALALAGQDPPAPGVTATLKGHTDSVYAVAFSPDGKLVVTGSFDNTVKLWDAATGKEVKTFAGPTGHQKLVLCSVFSHNGASLATGGSDNTAKIWDVPTTSHLRQFDGGDAFNAVALSPDGTKLAGAGKDGAVKVWNAADGKELFTLKGHTGPVTGVAFSNNNAMLASSGSDKTVRFWDVAKGQPLGVVGAHAGSANAVVFNPNNTVAYSAGDDGLLKFWQLPVPAAKPLPAHNDAVTVVGASADGTQILTASADKNVRLQAAANPQQAKTFTASAAVISAMLSPNGATIAAGTADNRLFLFNVADGKALSQSVAHAGPVNGVAFHPQNTQVLTGGGDGLVKIWAFPPVPSRSLTHPDGVTTSLLTPDGKRLFTGSADKVLRAWNLGNNQVERQFTGHGGAVTAVALSPNGQDLASGGADETIRFWNQANGQQIALLGGHAGPVTSLSFHPNGQQLLSAAEDGTVKLWQLPLVAPKPFVHPDQVTSAVLTPDGGKLLTGSNDKQVRLWNLTNNQVERTFPALALPVSAVAISSNGATVAAGGADKTITLWNAGDSKEIKKIADLAGEVRALVFSPDGAVIAAGLSDNSVRLFSVAEGKEVKKLEGHGGAVTAVVFTPKGDQVLSASADKTIQLWNVADGANKGKWDHGSPIHCLALNKDGTQAISGAADKSLKVWTLADGKNTATIATPAEVRGAGFNADGTRIVAAGADNRARVYGLDGKVLEFFPHDGPVLVAAYHSDGKRIVTASADKTARLWTPALIWQRAHGGPARQAIFSAKGDQIVSAGDDKIIKLWNPGDGKEIKALTGHDGAVVGVGLSADGAKVVSVGADKTLRVWNPNEAKVIASIALPGPGVSLALSPNGVKAAVACQEKDGNPIRVYDLASGKELMSIAEAGGAIRSLAFAADNRTLASSSLDKSARLTDVGVLAAFEAHPGGVTSVAYHSNGTQALTGGADKTVKLWDLTTGKELKKFGPLAEAVSALAFSRDFTQIGAAAGKTVTIWNAADGKEVLTLTHPVAVASLSFSPDKTRMVTGAADNLARVWDVASGKELEFFGHGGPVRSVYFLTNTNLVSGSADKSATIQTMAATRVLPVSTSPIKGLALTPNATHMLTASNDKTVKLWNLGNGANERTFAGSGGEVQAVAVSKNGALVAAGGADNALRLYTFADGKEIAKAPTPGAIRGLAFSPNNLILAAACADRTLATFSLVTAQGQTIPTEVKAGPTFQHAAGVSDVVFAADSANFYSASLDKTIKNWKLASDAAVRSFQHPNLVDAVAFSPDGTLLATGCHDGAVRLFDIAKNQPLRQIDAHTKAVLAPGAPPAPAPVYSVAWSPDGKQILTGSLDRSMKLFDAGNGNLVKEFKPYTEKTFEKGHRDGVFSVAFSPDGKLVASGSSDRRIKLWNPADGEVVREFPNPKLKADPPESHPGWVYSLRFTKDGKRLISAGAAPKNQGYLGVWNVEDGKLLFGQELPLGPIYSVAVSDDGKRLVLGCGPRGRQATEVDAYIMKMPE